jgi:c(7)-type cytochrome triheme protein
MSSYSTAGANLAPIFPYARHNGNAKSRVSVGATENGRPRAGLFHACVHMHNRVSGLLFISVVALTSLLAQDKKPPVKLVLPAKNGNIVFDHSAHVKHEKNNCKACHPALFAQDAKAAVGFKPPHKVEEDKMTSCGSCHRAGGSAFETKANCTNSKCHVTARSKKG